MCVVVVVVVVVEAERKSHMESQRLEERGSALRRSSDRRTNGDEDDARGAKNEDRETGNERVAKRVVKWSAGRYPFEQEIETVKRRRR
jgi:hypothetical protein